MVRDMSETSIQRLPDWHWRIIVYTEERGELVLGAYEPTRAAAKQYVADRLELDVVEWRRTYVPRPSWDCPVCNVHEGANKVPNLRGSYDWECNVCGSKFWGEPMEWDRIEEGSRAPEHRLNRSRDRTKQQTLGGDEA